MAWSSLGWIAMASIRDIMVSERRQLITLGLAVLVFMMTLFALNFSGPRARVARVAIPVSRT
jgi:hypothetical protein